MARAARNPKLDSRTARLKLKPGRYFVLIVSGLSLMYRRTVDGSGTWSARIAGDDGRESYHKLADADDYQDADSETVLNFPQAQQRARNLAKEAKATPKGKLVTVAEVTAHYLDWYREHRRAYRETEATVNAHILPAWGDKLLMEITAPDIRRWHEKLAVQPARKRTVTGATKQAFREKAVSSDEKRARKSTANRILTVFKAILNRAFRDGMVSDDAAWRRVKPFENADEPVTRFLTTAESTRLINACHPDFRPLVKAALFTGCRYGELARLTVADVNTDTGMIYVTSEAKSGKGRHVPLSVDGQDFFESAIVGKTGSAYVFFRADGEPWGKNHHVRLLKAACEQARIAPAIGFHDLRHTYASLLAQAGADLLTISKLLGHADTRITSRHYAHLCDKTLANAVRTLLPSFGHQSDNKVKDIGSRKV
jgi:integrase